MTPSGEDIPRVGSTVLYGDNQVGYMKVGDWSPTLKAGIGYVLFDQSGNGQDSWLGQSLTLCDIEDEHHNCEIVSLPFYDAEKKIPRGLEVAEI